MVVRIREIMTVPLEYQTGFAAASLVDPGADALIGLLQTRYPDMAAEWILSATEVE